ncbi:MAG: hypothetical protein ACLUSP_01860 [Christensenellales bacterium]
MPQGGRFDDVPTMIRVKSDRTLLYAKSVAEFYARTEGLGKTEKPSAVVSPADYPASPVEELIARGLIIADGTKKYIVSLEAGKEAPGNENDDTYAQNHDAAIIVTDSADHGKTEPTETEKAAARAELLAEKARRHEREYSRPTEYGLDKADSFFDDEKRSPSLKKRPTERGRFVAYRKTQRQKEMNETRKRSPVIPVVIWIAIVVAAVLFATGAFLSRSKQAGFSVWLRVCGCGRAVWNRRFRPKVTFCASARPTG